LNSPTSTVPPSSALSKGSPSPVKSSEAVKRPSSTTSSPTKVLSQTNGSTPKPADGSPPAKKKITINREPLPAPAVPQPDATEKADDKDKKVVKISALTAEEKAKLRQAKFGSEVASEETAVAAKPKSGADSAAAVSVNPFLDERLKKRAARFGSAGGGGEAAVAAVPTPTGKISVWCRKI
jgi:hypothetical protein